LPRLAREIKDEIRGAKKIRLSWSVKLYGITGSILCCWLFDHFGRFDLALPTLNCVAMLGCTAALKWKLRWNAWFWITMAILAALHVPLILFVPWTIKWVPAIAIAAIDSADLIVMPRFFRLSGSSWKDRKPLKDEHPFPSCAIILIRGWRVGGWRTLSPSRRHCNRGCPTLSRFLRKGGPG